MKKKTGEFSFCSVFEKIIRKTIELHKLTQTHTKQLENYKSWLLEVLSLI